MSDYTPSSRRPIADLFRATAHTAVRICVKRGISPDAVSYASIVAALIAGVCFWKSGQWPWLLVAAPVFCVIRLWLNMLDGMVAIAAKKASKRGEIVNEVPDRISDLLIFAGVAHSGFASPTITYWAALGAIMTAYIGVTGQAIAGRREYGGLMSKPWRMVLLSIAAFSTFALLHTARGDAPFFSLKLFDWACLIIVAGCVQTCVVRLRSMLRLLDTQ